MSNSVHIKKKVIDWCLNLNWLVLLVLLQGRIVHCHEMVISAAFKKKKTCSNTMHEMLMRLCCRMNALWKEKLLKKPSLIKKPIENGIVFLRATVIFSFPESFFQCLCCCHCWSMACNMCHFVHVCPWSEIFEILKRTRKKSVWT